MAAEQNAAWADSLLRDVTAVSCALCLAGFTLTMLIITIKQGKEKSLLAGDPWIYASAIERVDGHGKPGATALVQNSARKFLARAAWAPKSQIQARVWTLVESQPVDHALIKNRIKAALAKSAAAAKKAMPDQLVRLVNAEEDGLPGLIVEGFGGAGGQLLCQFQAAGVDAWKIPIVQALIAATGCPNVYEMSDELVRKGEGLPVKSRTLAGEEPPARISLVEKGVRFQLELRTGERRAVK
jgi:23S rRNA (cytosine1962-C5)-methyltransferase